MQARLLFVSFLIFVMPACGGGSHSTPAPGVLSGNWQMSMQKDNASGLAPKTESGFLSQAGNQVTGSLILHATPCSGVGSVSGTVTGSNVSFVITPVGVTVNLTGTVASGQTSMSGDYTIISQGCGGSQTAPEIGTWTANLVQPLKGNFTGTFTSKKSGTSYAVTGQATQQPANGTSSAALSGNLGATGYCFSSTNLTGVISGTTVALNLMSTDGSTQIGVVTGTSAFDGTLVAGTYAIFPQGPTGQSPCQIGDSGTATLTF